MSKDIQIFNNDKFGQLRTVIIDNEPWFVGKDVANTLGYSDTNKAVAMHVDDEDKKLNDKTSPSFGQRGATLINESGVYSLVFGSKLESAKEFKHWVTHDVLPAIRKTGAYQVPKVTPNPHYRTRMVKTAVTDIGGTAQAIMLTYHVKPGMALAAAQEMVGKAYGIDMAPLQRLIPAETNPGYLNATAIAEHLGLKGKSGKPNAADANKLLEASGLQEKRSGHWHLTEKGKAYGEEKPYSRNHHSGYQIVWGERVYEVLK
jgi:prophage antirepressor-like protein